MAQRHPWTVWVLLVILACNLYHGEARTAATPPPTATTLPTTTSSTPPPTTTTPPSSPPVPPTPPNVTVTTQNTTSITFNITVQEGACVIVNWNGGTLTNDTVCVTANVTSDPISYTTIGVLTPGTCYNFTMTAKRDGLISTVKTNSACTAPSSPVTVRATTQTNTSITLTIVKGEGNVKCYIISTSLIDPANRTCTMNTSGRTSTYTTYNYTGLGPGQGHTFQVRAMYKDFTSDEFTSNQIYTVPSTPAGFVTITQTTTSIQLNITKGTGNVDCYIISTSPIQDGDTSCDVSATITSERGTTYTTYNYTDLNPGQGYTFYVKAKYKNLTSDVLTSNQMYTGE